MAHKRTTEALLVTGANPVRELLASAHPIERIWVRGALPPELAGAAAARGVAVEMASPEVLARITAGAAHQGVVARMAEYRYAELGEVVEAAGRAVLVLDGIQDPQNLGAILRTARAAGVAGVVIPKDRAAAVTGAVASASAGHVFGVKLARVTNLVRACEALKAAGWWLVGLVAGADRDVFEVGRGLERPALVVGSEGSGLRQLVRQGCDFEAAIPMAAGVESLNVSVATGIALYALTRREPSS